MKKIAALALASGLAAGAGAEDNTGAAFLRMSPSVQAEALGGMNPAAATGAGSMGVNPANIAGMKANEFTSGYASVLGGSSYGTVGMAVRRGKGAAVGIHGTFLQSGELEGRDAGGNETSAFNAQSLSAGITAAWGTDGFRAGVTGKAVREEIGQYKSNTAPALDAGMSLKTGRIEWAAAALNLGGKLTIRGHEESLPSIYSLGAGVPLGGGLKVLAALSQTSGETTASGGLEYDLGPASLRAGYRSGGASNLAQQNQKQNVQALEGLTGGLGASWGSLRLDYAVSQGAAEWGMSQRVALTWTWGAAPEKAARRPASRPAERRAAPKPSAKPPVSTGTGRAYDATPTRQKRKKTWVY